MKRRRFLFIIVLPSIIILSLVMAIILGRELRQPPYEKLQQAISLLESARECRGQKSSGLSYQSAQELLEAGRQAILKTTSSWWPFESFSLADSLLTESMRLSDLAMQQADNERSQQKMLVELKIGRLEDSLTAWRKVMDNSLPRTDNELLYRKARTNLRIARNMFSQRQYESAGEYVDMVSEILGTLEHPAASSQTWIRQAHEWAARTVQESKKSRTTALIVDKSRHQLYVLSRGKIVDSMSCDLGYNSGHQKQISGDGATPEGRYNITHVNRNSKYYRALMLNYPNADDRRRFQTNLSEGRIRRNSKIGGLIEIHGHGGTGRDWTDGCVAVTDKDMLKLLKLASVGTAVAIVRIWDDRP